MSMRRLMQVSVFAFGLLLVGTPMAPLSLAAQGRGRFGNAREMGYQEGYRAGQQQGVADARRGVSQGYRIGRGDSGNNATGNRGQYRAGYVEGYRAGYDEAYSRASSRSGRGDWGRGRRDDVYSGRRDDDYSDRYGRYGTARGANNVAFQNGYNRGLGAGREDLERSRGYSLERHGTWRDAVEGYSSRYGNKEEYRQAFRAGYERGYREGYQSFRR